MTIMSTGSITNNTFIGFTPPENISIGYNCKTKGQHSVATGYYAASTDDNTIAVGSFVSATHKNSTVLGSNLMSKRENSTLLNQAEFTEDGLHLNSGTSLISDVRSHLLANETEFNPPLCGGLNSYQEKCLPHRCTACNFPIKHGIKWIKDGYVIEDDGGVTQQYNDIYLGLCFDCVLGCVLEFKAKSAWNKDLV